MEPDAGLSQLRLAVLEGFVESGRAPTREELARRGRVTTIEARAGLLRLATAQVVVMQPDADAVWMAMPFSGVPSAFRVTAERREGVAESWWANCALDALGIGAMLAGAEHQSARGPIHVATTCGDCDSPLALTVHPNERSPDAAVRAAPEGADAPPPVAHFAVAARHWWDDIGFT